MLSTNKNNFTSPLPTQMHFIQFLLHIVQTKISSTMLNKSDEDTHSCFVFYLGRKTLSSTTKYWGHYILFFFFGAIYFLSMSFFKLRIFSSLWGLMRAFIQNGLWILPNAFSLLRLSHLFCLFFLFQSLNIVNYIDCFKNVQLTLHS